MYSTDITKIKQRQVVNQFIHQGALITTNDKSLHAENKAKNRNSTNNDEKSRKNAER